MQRNGSSVDNAHICAWNVNRRLSTRYLRWETTIKKIAEPFISTHQIRWTRRGVAAKISDALNIRSIARSFYHHKLNQERQTGASIHVAGYRPTLYKTLRLLFGGTTPLLSNGRRKYYISKKITSLGWEWIGFTSDKSGHWNKYTDSKIHTIFSNYKDKKVYGQ